MFGQIMFGWHNVWLTQCLADEMFGQNNFWLTLCLAVTVFGQHNVWLTKCLADAIFGWCNIWPTQYLAHECNVLPTQLWPHQLTNNCFDKKSLDQKMRRRGAAVPPCHSAAVPGQKKLQLTILLMMLNGLFVLQPPIFLLYFTKTTIIITKLWRLKESYWFLKILDVVNAMSLLWNLQL
jgi:hypothetical protein